MEPNAPEPLKPAGELTPDDADAAIAAFNGDAREAVKALLADNATLQRELDFAGLAMSYGFTRGWFAHLREGKLG